MVHLHMEFDSIHEDVRVIEDDYHTPIADRVVPDDN